MKLAVYALAVWRLTSLFVTEDGPFSVFWRIRASAGVYKVEQTQLSILFSCFWCASVWTAGALYFAPRWLRVILAGSGAAILVDRVREKVDLRQA